MGAIDGNTEGEFANAFLAIMSSLYELDFPYYHALSITLLASFSAARLLFGKSFSPMLKRNSDEYTVDLAFEDFDDILFCVLSCVACETVTTFLLGWLSIAMRTRKPIRYASAIIQLLLWCAIVFLFMQHERLVIWTKPNWTPTRTEPAWTPIKAEPCQTPTKTQTAWMPARTEPAWMPAWAEPLHTQPISSWWTSITQTMVTAWSYLEAPKTAIKAIQTLIDFHKHIVKAVKIISDCSKTARNYVYQIWTCARAMLTRSSTAPSDSSDQPPGILRRTRRVPIDLTRAIRHLEQDDLAEQREPQNRESRSRRPAQKAPVRGEPSQADMSEHKTNSFCRESSPAPTAASDFTVLSAPEGFQSKYGRDFFFFW